MMLHIVFTCMLALSGLLLVQGVGQQSPINIETWNVTINQTLGELKMEYSAANATMINKGYAIQVTWSEDAGMLEIDGVEYRLKQCHWHIPSEHTINGIRYNLELHMVHQSENENGTINIAVIGILYYMVNKDSDAFLTPLEWAIDKIAEGSTEIDLGVVDPNIIGFHRNATYYRYDGSLTTEPYTEGVTWTVIKQVKKVRYTQVEKLLNALPGYNARELQYLSVEVQVYEGEDADLVSISEKYRADQTILSWSS